MHLFEFIKQIVCCWFGYIRSKILESLQQVDFRIDQIFPLESTGIFSQKHQSDI